MSVSRVNSFRSGPDESGHFGFYGGRYVAETLMPLVLALERAYRAARGDPAFADRMRRFQAEYIGRPSPLYYAERLTGHLGGAKIYFKRDELNHTGAHKVNNCLGQILLALRMGKTRIIAETGAGQHGVATAAVCARFGLPCIVYMGETDMVRQQPNVFRMRLMGAEVRPVKSGTATLKDAMNEALRDWVSNVADTFYCIGTVAGPHPYPAMVRDFQSVIGEETRWQMHEREGRLPDLLVAAIGGGSNAMGLFHPFLDDASVGMLGVEAAGEGVETGRHAASLTGGKPGVLHGNRTYLLQNGDGQIVDAHSISAGLDYPGIGPEHAWLHDMGRVTYVSATDREALEAFQLCSRKEGIIPALEPSHALAAVMRVAPTLPADRLLVMNMCGRGDKDIFTVAKLLGGKYLMSGRIEARFAAVKAANRAALITFVTAGDPDLASSASLLASLPEAGADIIELGMPFTDPVADGPVIQEASLRALAAGASLIETLAMVADFRKKDPDTPVVLMGYYNPIHYYGPQRFITDAKAAGIDGVIVVDLPAEEDAELRLPAEAAGIRIVRLATPTTDDARLPTVLRNTGGFLYYVSIAGVTGGAGAVEESVAAAIARLRQASSLPLAVGFGIRTPDQAAKIARMADAVVVGSAIVATIGASLDAHGKATIGTIPAALDLVRSLARGVRGARENSRP